MKIKKKIKWLIIGMVLVVIIVIAAVGMKTSVSVQTAEAKSGTIRSYVEERARTTLPRVHRITMPFNGRVEPIILQEGSSVKKGDVVARLDTENLETELTQYNEVVEAFEVGPVGPGSGWSQQDGRGVLEMGLRSGEDALPGQTRQ